MGSNGRIFVRKSGTQQLIRVLIEHESAEMLSRAEDKIRELIREAIFDVMTEGLCPKGKAYIAKRKRAGEKSSA